MKGYDIIRDRISTLRLFNHWLGDVYDGHGSSAEVRAMPTCNFEPTDKICDRWLTKQGLLFKRLELLFKRLELLFKRLELLFKRLELLFKRLELLFKRLELLFKRLELLFKRLELLFKRLELLLTKRGLSFIMQVRSSRLSLSYMLMAN